MKQTFTLADLVAMKCPKEGIEWYLRTFNNPYEDYPVILITDVLLPSWFASWFRSNIAPGPVKGLKEIELPSAPYSSVLFAEHPVMFTDLNNAAYNYLLDAAHPDTPNSWARKIISDICAKHGYKPKGW